jgi:sugar lactone lactonase YvrE
VSKSWIVAGLITLLCSGYLVLKRSPIDAVAWEPPASSGLVGPFEANDALSSIQLITIPDGHAPESFTLGPDGWLYTGLKGGRIIRFRPDGSAMEDFADTGGRANGMRFDAAGNLIVVDSYRGLLAIDPSGAVTTLAESSDGVPFMFNDGVDIASDGTIWFTDATARFRDGEFHLEILEGSATGRVLTHDPVTGETQTRIDNLRFANGLALGPDDAYVLINEMLAYRTLRHWIQGPKAGTTEVFVDGYPGMPDDIQFNGKDLFWIAFAAERVAIADWVQPYPTLKTFIAKAIGDIIPDTDTRWLGGGAFVIALDLDGRVVHNLQDGGRRFISSTGALEHEGKLFLGSITMDAIGVVPVPRK